MGPGMVGGGTTVAPEQHAHQAEVQGRGPPRPSPPAHAFGLSQRAQSQHSPAHPSASLWPTSSQPSPAQPSASWQPAEVSESQVELLASSTPPRLTKELLQQQEAARRRGTSRPSPAVDPGTPGGRQQQEVWRHTAPQLQAQVAGGGGGKGLLPQGDESRTAPSFHDMVLQMLQVRQCGSFMVARHLSL